VLIGVIDEKKGDIKSALKNALDAQLLSDRRSAAARIQLQYWIAGLYVKAEAPEVAIRIYQEIWTEMGRTQIKGAGPLVELGVSMLPSREGIVFLEGGLLEQKGEWQQAVATYKRALDAPTDGVEPNPRALYAYARALSKTGSNENREKSREAFRKLASEAQKKKDEFWSKMAEEALKVQREAKEGST
jgi:tetratricopeptide (TPR) repeat protein